MDTSNDVIEVIDGVKLNIENRTLIPKIFYSLVDVCQVVSLVNLIFTDHSNVVGERKFLEWTDPVSGDEHQQNFVDTRRLLWICGNVITIDYNGLKKLIKYASAHYFVRTQTVKIRGHDVFQMITEDNEWLLYSDICKLVNSISNETSENDGGENRLMIFKLKRIFKGLCTLAKDIGSTEFVQRNSLKFSVDNEYSSNDDGNASIVPLDELAFHLERKLKCGTQYQLSNSMIRIVTLRPIAGNNRLATIGRNRLYTGYRNISSQQPQQQLALQPLFIETVNAKFPFWTKVKDHLEPHEIFGIDWSSSTIRLLTVEELYHKFKLHATLHYSNCKRTREKYNVTPFQANRISANFRKLNLQSFNQVRANCLVNDFGKVVKAARQVYINYLLK